MRHSPDSAHHSSAAMIVRAHKPDLARRRARTLVSSGHAARPRRGVALISILAMLALSAALLAGGFAAATASARATRSVRAGIVASAATRRALARALLAWSSAEERLGVGAMIERDASEPVPVPRDAAGTRVRVQRLSQTLYVIATDVVVPARGIPLARRRMRLLVRRVNAPDSTVVAPPRPLSQWSLEELF